ncbi:hypothetical protein OSTOST_20074 [Ostertagia ostertagi]
MGVIAVRGAHVFGEREIQASKPVATFKGKKTSWPYAATPVQQVQVKPDTGKDEKCEQKKDPLKPVKALSPAPQVQAKSEVKKPGTPVKTQKCEPVRTVEVAQKPPKSEAPQPPKEKPKSQIKSIVPPSNQHSVAAMDPNYETLHGLSNDAIFPKKNDNPNPNKNEVKETSDNAYENAATLDNEDIVIKVSLLGKQDVKFTDNGLENFILYPAFGNGLKLLPKCQPAAVITRSESGGTT